MLKLTRDWYLALAVVTCGVIYSLPLSAQSPVSTEIRACVHNGNNQLRVVAAGQSCASNEHLVVWNTVGPKGDKGDKGDTGATGAQGPQGIPGNVGPRGFQGLPGNVGPQGPAGKDGRDGLDGRPGNIGPQGPVGQDGKDGAPGNMGPRGFDGAPGTPGATGPAGPGGGIIIGIVNPFQCGATLVTSSALAVHVVNTNLFAPVAPVFGVPDNSGNKTPGLPGDPKGKPKGGKPVRYFPFEFVGVPTGNWTIEVGNFVGPVDDANGPGTLVAYPRFVSQNMVANVLVTSGGVTNIGTINLDQDCAGAPTEICGNGIDDNGNGLADENCPCVGNACLTPVNCDDLGLVSCADGTCRNSLAACPTSAITPPATCATLTCGSNEVCQESPLKGAGAQCVCAKGYEADANGACVAIDACASGANNCAANAFCAVTGPGTFTCVCPVGTTGDGVTCTPIVVPPSGNGSAGGSTNTTPPAPVPDPGGGAPGSTTPPADGSGGAPASAPDGSGGGAAPACVPSATVACGDE